MSVSRCTFSRKEVASAQGVDWAVPRGCTYIESIAVSHQGVMEEVPIDLFEAEKVPIINQRLLVIRN